MGVCIICNHQVIIGKKVTNLEDFSSEFREFSSFFIKNFLPTEIYSLFDGLEVSFLDTYGALAIIFCFGII